MHPTPPTHTKEPTQHQAVLDELAQLGLHLARHVQQLALSSTDAGELTNLAAAFDKVARTTRRTVQLCQHLAWQPRPPCPARTRELARRQAIRTMDEDLEGRPEPERQALRREFLDRLDHPDTEADFLDTPADQVVETIRRDLGLFTIAGRTFFKRRTLEETEALNHHARTLASAGPEPGGGLRATRGHQPPERPAPPHPTPS